MSEERARDLCLPEELLGRVFPFYLALAPSGEVLQAGPVLARLCPALETGPHIEDHFLLRRPLHELLGGAMTARPRHPTLVELRAPRLRLRGEFYWLPRCGAALFLGSPRVEDTSELRALGLSLLDFAPHDAASEAIFLAHAHRSALDDARALNAKLQRQAEELVLAHREALSASRFKSELLTNVNHELRTPLHALLSLTQELLGGGAPSRDKLGALHASAYGLLATVTNLLDMSDLLSGGLSPEAVAFGLWEVLEAAAAQFSAEAAVKGLRLVCQIAPGAPRRAVGDPVMLRVIASHLLSNALKFTERGEVVLRFAPGAGVDEYLLEVQDTGIGVDLAQVERLFVPFGQADSSSQRRYGGAGLGLAIVSELAQRLGGEAGCRCAPGGGSIFWTRLRLAPAPPEPEPALVGRVLTLESSQAARIAIEYALGPRGAQVEHAEDAVQAAVALRVASIQGRPFSLLIAEAARLSPVVQDAATGARAVVLWYPAPQAEPPPLPAVVVTQPLRPSLLLETLHELPSLVVQQRPRVLLAEDNPVNQRVARLLLEKLGYEVQVASDGREAVEEALSSRYAAVLLDCQMPGCDGYQATAEIRRRERGGRVPIIAMTANVTRGARETCLAAGMDDYLPKPVRVEELAQALRRWIAPSAQGEPSAIDAAILEDLRALSPSDGDDLISGVIDLYLQDASARLRALQEALAAQDATRAQRESHSLKGSASSVGAREVVSACQAIEQLARAHRCEEASTLLNALRRALQRTERALYALRLGGSREPAAAPR